MDESGGTSADFLIAGSFTACLTRLGGGCGSAVEGSGLTAQLLRLFSQSEVAISPSEASELLRTAVDVAATRGREGEPWCEAGSWGAFCTACLQSVIHKHRRLHPPPQSRSVRRSKGSGSESCQSGQYHVFLGGSCNPTSWRKDIVIPCLLKEGISFYNPQVDHWSPELIDIEEEAKEAASTLLYVIDNQTRAVSSMVEVANFVGSGRDVLVVVSDIKGEAPVIGKDLLSQREVEDLNRGRAFVRTVSEAAGNLVVSSVQRAVASLLDISRWGQCVSEDSSTFVCEDQRSPKAELSSGLRLLQQVHTMYDTERRGHLTEDEAQRALQALECDQRTTHAILSWTLESLLRKRDKISLEEFVVLFCEARYWTVVRPGAGGEGEGEERGLLGKTSGYLRGNLHRLTNWLWSSPSTTLPPLLPPLTTSCDVYLGGSCGTTSWRHDDIIPVLRQYGVTYFNPQVTSWDTSLISVEQTARDQCAVLLYVIGGDTLSVGSMVEVAYNVDRGRKMVLALSDIPTSSPDTTGPTLLEEMQLSGRAVRDYNRGRAYLASMARKRHIPLYSNSVDAALCAVYIVRGFEIPSHESLPLQGTSV